ncbi:hypothetical protein FEDK69T_22060 [Flavobacterium enshiense DK69]|uniref:Uncharacterized protein n=1 Tax=Flavobacterium enshiense DK69 TaxID=1107311 RepID=V6S755_9FLAO|nr:hypothetical protein [Flavobacterium enshiense]ESU22224.1 hypothetical protein FEDK69T_22060 [Flavobacterium enshiense DK69]KGO97237.1 hypothetical protein Q767_01125 [Flavobacterium enshiense DK69]
MAKEDLLSKQINQLGFFLRKVLEKMTGADSECEMTESVSENSTVFKETLGFDLNDIQKLQLHEVVPFLLQNEYFSVENLELFADILVKTNAEDFSKKALKIYEHIDSKTATFSMERNLKIKMIKERFL